MATTPNPSHPSPNGPAVADGHGPAHHAGPGHPPAPLRPRVDPMALLGEEMAASLPATPPRHGPAVAVAKPAAAAAAAKPAAKGQAPGGAAPTAPRKPLNWKLLAGVGGGVAVAAGVVALLVLEPWKAEPPRLNQPPATIAKFAVSDDFTKLPFDRKVAYMEALEDKEKELEAAYNAGQLNDEQFRKALQAEWLGKHLIRMKKWHAKAPGPERDAYLDKLIEKKNDGDGGDEGADAAAAKPADPKAAAAKPATPSPRPVGGIKVQRDESEEAVEIASWPTEVRAQWSAYRRAWKDRKEYVKDQDKAREKAARAERARAATRQAN